MRVAVTGSSGFVGQRLGMRLGPETLWVDLGWGTDICDMKTAGIINDFDPHVIYHLAARHFIPWCEAYPDETFRTNVLGTAQTILAIGPSIQTVVFASSAAVYGFSPSPITEAHDLNGRGIYARTKLLGEALMETFSDHHPDVRCVTARLFNVVGADDGHAHVLPRIVNEHRASRAVTLGNLWPQRDYIHVEDVADALIFLAQHAPVGHSTWNVGTGIGTTVQELVNLVEQLSGRPVLLTPGRGRSDDGHLVSDPSTLRAFGWEAKHTLRDAVREVVDAHS